VSLDIIESAIPVVYARLTTDNTVASFVGTRVFPVFAPTGTDTPLIVMQIGGVDREHSLTAPIGRPVVTVSVTLYATTYNEVRKLSRAVRRALDGFAGTVAGATVQRTMMASESDGFEPPGDGETMPSAYTVSQTYDMRLVETI
jgi:hypothetical protein